MRVLIVAGERAVGVEGGRIVAADGDFDEVLRFPAGQLAPGLINAHEHLHRNHYGRLGRPPYRNARHWAGDIQRRDSEAIAAGQLWPRRAALLAGAWKNLFSGVTTVVHHDAWEPEFDRDFPLRVVPLRSANSLQMDPQLEALEGHDGPFALHLAEGVDAEAAQEVRTLADRGLLTRELIAVHGVGMDDQAVARFRASGAALVWCPSSNHFLFGRTARADLLADGVDVLLGSNSRLTGDGDLLDELGRARACGLLEDDRLCAAVGAVAARRLVLPPPTLEPGSAADIIVLGRPLLEARARDVLLVIAGGVPRVAEPAFGDQLNRLSGEGELSTVGGVTRWTSGTTLSAQQWRMMQ